MHSRPIAESLQSLAIRPSGCVGPPQYEAANVTQFGFQYESTMPIVDLTQTRSDNPNETIPAVMNRTTNHPNLKRTFQTDSYQALLN
ncbi:hypothetical protein T265_07523 [Opisthorchis viverrini]|uniref:Uncharacterized protein n=1 Tax=Opisthorchis viverrini TaxID=6198 RepID=A0A074ZCK7_OPIVI|nr:hypothetical protein T265_07523 [Opisthorchis viverrini]KER24898.1 hypothetical protein T265_07523 [Opisthorchis viverrini]